MSYWRRLVKYWLWNWGFGDYREHRKYPDELLKEEQAP
jgi:hypothetical protein